MFLVGLSINFIKNITNSKEPAKFDYSKEDSLFNEAENRSVKTKITDKKVDSEQELLDFSKNESSIEKQDSSSSVGSPLNINTATIEQLIQLPGIGEKTALAILELRKSKGKFNDLNEILEVKGIGKAKLEKIKPLIFIEK